MLQTTRRLFFRAERHPSQHLAYCVRSAGHYILGPDWPGEDRSPSGFVQLFWVIHGSGMVWIDGQWMEAGPGVAFFYRDGESHRLKIAQDHWEYRWLTLWEVQSRQGLDAMPPPHERLWSAGRCPAEEFDALYEAVSDPSRIGERRSSAIAYRILVAAFSGPVEPDPQHPLVSLATDWLGAHFADPGTSVDALAQHCKVHRSTLFRAFRMHTGVTPSDFLRRLRVQRALRLLRETARPVSEIARQSGFNDPNFLARCVREKTGLSPVEFRKVS